MDYVVELENISRSFGNLRVLKDLSLKVRRGEVFGLVGPNGAGKTTTVRLLLGLLAPHTGHVRVLGEAVRESNGNRKVGSVLEVSGLYSDLNIEENIRLYAMLYGLLDWKELMRSVLEFIGLWDRRHDLIGTFSKGMRQKVALARAMILEPELLIMDEPTSGIDPVFQTDLRQKILDYANNGGTVFFCSHNMAEVEELCSAVAVLDDGQIVKSGTVATIVQEYEERFYELWLGRPVDDFKALARTLAPLCCLRQTRSSNHYRLVLRDDVTVKDLTRNLSEIGINGTVVPAKSSFSGVVDYLLAGVHP